jgi:ribosomal protein S18 acetylase RimI-like enzyme
MILRDWREADPAVLGECYEREQQHWLDGLSWDTTWTWATVEQARFARGLPGYIAVDDGGRVQGWTFYVIDDGAAHIGGLVASSEETTRALLDSVLQGSAHADVDATACFVLDRAPGLTAALARHGFAVEPFHYLSLALRSRGLSLESQEAAAVAEPWRDGDLEAIAGLLAASYPDDAGRHFAPGGNWEKYATGLVEQAGCGVFDTNLTRVVRGEGGVRGAVLVTSISAAAAHVAQLAVAPEYRGRGVARHLVHEAAARAAMAGKRELTLLVGDSNERARRLYAAMGFTQKAIFLAARRQNARESRYVAAS